MTDSVDWRWCCLLCLAQAKRSAGSEAEGHQDKTARGRAAGQLWVPPHRRTSFQ